MGYAASAWRSETRHGSFARASAAIGGGLTLLPHMAGATIGLAMANDPPRGQEVTVRSGSCAD